MLRRRLPAQQAGQVARGRNGGYTLTRDVDEVVLNATVIDDHSRLVQGLNKDDFHVFEDGKPQNITALQEQDIPVSIGLLVDNSRFHADETSGREPGSGGYGARVEP